MPWQLDDDFDATARALEEGARRIQTDTAQKVKADAQAKAPVKSGRLRDSARVEETAEGATVVFDAPYAGLIESGHMNAQGKLVAGKHFLTNSLNANQETLESAGEGLLRDLGSQS